MDPALFAEALGDGQFRIDWSIGRHALRYEGRVACERVTRH